MPPVRLFMIIINPDGTVNWDAVTGASPEVALISGPGDYTLLVEGYQVYFGRSEFYCIEIVYFADSTPLWSSSIVRLKWFRSISSPVTGLAAVWLYDIDFDHWYIGGFTLVKMKGRGEKNWLLIKKKDAYSQTHWALEEALTEERRGRLREKTPPCQTD